MNLHHLLLLISGLWSPSSAGFRYYYLVTEPKTWVQAQSYCRQQYTDLAIVDNMAEMQQLKGLIPPGFSDSIWIGLKTGSVKHWGWSSGEVLQYAKWSPGQPDNENLEGICGGMYKSGGFVDMFCTNKYQFVCYSESLRKFILVKTLNTWRAAQTYCRQYYTDLATIHSEQELQRVWGLLTNSDTVWIGLFFGLWEWSDGKKTTFQNWYSGQPWIGDCAAVSTKWIGYWFNTVCDDKIAFMCYKAPNKRLIRLKVTSGGETDLNDPVVMANIQTQITQTLRKQGVGPDTTLTWRNIRGTVFSLDKTVKEQQKKCSN
uniref:C-type lectin domain-containing protein n=1 Tax=Astyanax mexicanus TaxID=7994 RepID=A0A3B1JXZ4_ASTMX